MDDIADGIVSRILAEIDEAQRRVASYGATVEQSFARIGDAAARGAGGVAEAAGKQGGAVRELADKASKAAKDVADLAKGLTALGKESADPKPKKAAEAATALTKDLATGLKDAIVNGKSLGDVLVKAFTRAGEALLQSRIINLLDPKGDGSGGFLKAATGVLGTLYGPARASGGHVSAGQLYRVNEVGVEGFRPAGSGTIVPLGRMAARVPAGVTIIQPLNVSFAGAITTTELMAEFKAYADGVGQAAAIGGAAMAQGRIARRSARLLPR